MLNSHVGRESKIEGNEKKGGGGKDAKEDAANVCMFVCFVYVWLHSIGMSS